MMLLQNLLFLQRRFECGEVFLVSYQGWSLQSALDREYR